MNGQQESVRRLSTASEIEAIADPLRLDLLQLFAARPRTPKQAAEALGIPPTRVYHHVGVLERERLVEVVETRPKRGAREKYYAATARLLRLDPDLVQGETSPGSACALGTLALEAALADVQARFPRESATDEDGTGFLARASLRLTVSEMESLAADLSEVLARYETTDDDPATERRLYRVTAVGVLPSGAPGPGTAADSEASRQPSDFRTVEKDDRIPE